MSPHRSCAKTIEDGWWVEAIPLPFYGIRKRCECGRGFWRDSSYRRHWRAENRKAIAAENADPARAS